MSGRNCEPLNGHNKIVKEIETRLRQEKELQRKWEEQQSKSGGKREKQEAIDRQRRETDQRNRKEEAERQRRREQEEKLRREEEAARMEAAMRRLEEQERQAKLREEETRLAVEREEQLKKELTDRQRKRREQEEKLRREEEAARMEIVMRLLEEQERQANLMEEEVRLAVEREKELRKELADHERKTAEERDTLLRRVDTQVVLTWKRKDEAVEARRQQEKLRREAGERLLRAEEERIKYEREIERQKMESKRRETEVRQREEQARKDAEERKHRAEEERFRYEREIESQKLESERRETEAGPCEEQARKDAEELERRADEDREAFERELDATGKQLKDGIQPIVYPTKEEYDAAKDRVQYNPERIHAAICGPSGSGKSSLINALRGLKPGDPGAAGVGVIETTFEVTRYPDPRTEMPYPRFIWFDVPGAGTFDVPTWQYFNQQGLFIFDFIVLVYDIRFTQIDANVLENCQRFKIPALIVRSKATQQIEYLRDDLGCSLAEAREKYVTLVRRGLQDNLVKSKLYAPGDCNTPRVYIVSRECVYDHVIHLEELRTEKRRKKPIPEDQRKGGKLTAQYIDEEDLVRDLLATAYDRRYASEVVRSSRIMSSLAHAAVKLSIG